MEKSTYRNILKYLAEANEFIILLENDFSINYFKKSHKIIETLRSFRQKILGEIYGSCHKKLSFFPFLW